MQEKLHKEIKRLAKSYVANAQYSEEIDRGIMRQLQILSFRHNEGYNETKQVFQNEVEELFD